MRGPPGEGAGFIRDQVELGLHPGHRVDHAAERRHREGVHHGGGGQAEIDRTAFRNDELVDRGDAVFRVDEQPFPVERHGLDLDRHPENETWYRRDIGSITDTLGYAPAAPYFIDADLVDPEAWPRAGMTVVTFRNSHLSYALTWGALALMVVGGYGLFLRHEFRGRDED
ncbi:SURF1 family cytochrome oxidase biogenesis protein [Mangrovicoccus ximenensis]|uniref:SURF1 family cytochrome oxidase biogenesis protein n=1 Tax=Mangrovicoccus ximenensis TaxID=1911570 RepID=UPI001F20BE35|nr:SURF1 family cytochrome oxidase biogenesis protein [Mangrovicoccus ximenensis]